MQIFKCPALPHRLTGLQCCSTKSICCQVNTSNYSDIGATVLITAKGAVLFYSTRDMITHTVKASVQCNTESEGIGQTETKPFKDQVSEPVENREVFPQQQRERRFYFQYRPGVLSNFWSPGGDGDWKSQTGGSLGQEQLCEAISIFFSDKAFDRRFCAHKNTHHSLSMWVNKCSVSQTRSWPQKGSPCRFMLFVLPVAGVRIYSKESYQNLTKFS